MYKEDLLSLPNNNISDRSKLEAFADDKINAIKKTEICCGKDRKHCGKRRKCWLPAFSPFPTMFSKKLLFQGLIPTNLCFTTLRKSTFENIVGKEENSGNQHILLFQ